MNRYFLSFATIPELADNNNNSVSPIGELSNKTISFCKAPGVYTNDDSKTLLYVFYTLQEQKSTFIIPDEIANIQLEISDWVYKEATYGNSSNSSSLLFQNINTIFGDKIELLEVGNMVTNEKIWLPSYVKFKYVDSEGGTNNITFWMSDEYFEAQYPYREVQVVLPIPDEKIDDLFTITYFELEEYLKTQTPLVIQERENETTDVLKYPPTERKVYMFNAYDAVNYPTCTPTYFVCDLWGNITESDEDCYDAIRDKILSNSKYDEDQWARIYPDLFNPLEFTCIPNFDRVGLQNNTSLANTFSPIVDQQTIFDLPKKYMPDVSEAFFTKSSQVVPFYYKSVSVTFTAKENNYLDQFKIYDFIKDYQIIDCKTSDFERMEETTMEFILGMQELIEAALTISKADIPPSGISLQERNGFLMVSKRIGKIKYHMVTREQYVKDGVLEDD